MGGASAAGEEIAQAGFRSMLAPWLGGAAAEPGDAAPAPRGVVVTRAYLLRMRAARRALEQRRLRRERDEAEEEKAAGQQVKAEPQPVEVAPPAPPVRKRRRRNARLLGVARLALDD